MKRKILFRVLALFLVLVGVFTGVLFFKRTTPVVMYHHITSGPGQQALDVSVRNFDMQMRYLQEHGYRALNPEELKVRVVQGRLSSKEVLLTLDDGFQDNYDNALPILEKYGLKATFFIVADWVGKPGFMTWDEIRQMQRKGHTIGSHSVTHAMLTEIPLAKAKDEIYNSKHLIEKNLGTPIRFFCYPTGRFSPSLEAMVQEAGYDAAFTVAPGWAYSNRDPFALKRFRISESSDTTWKFWWRVSGYYLLFRERKGHRMKCIKDLM